MSVKLSYSRADRFTSCKFAFIHDYPQDGTVVAENKSLPLLGGKLFHQLAEKWGKKLAADPSLNSVNMAGTVLSSPKDLPYEVYEDIVEVFTAWSKRTVLEFPDKSRYELALAFNREWKAVKWDADDVFLRMVIDRVDLVTTPTRIVDYKTRRALESPKSLQQRTYAFGCNLALEDDRRAFDVGEQYVRFWAPIDFKTLVYDDYKDIGDYYLALADEIEATTEWPATINSWCGLCAHTGICPEYKKEIAGTDLDVTDMKGAVNLAQLVYASEAKNKAAKDVLKGFITEHGPTVFGDHEFGPAISHGYAWDDLEKVIEWLEANRGANRWNLLKLGKKEFTKATKGLGKDEIKAIVDEFGRPTSRQNFTFHKAKK